MIDITTQWNGQVFIPGESDIDTIKNEYKVNQPVRQKCTRVSKAMEPSIVQNNTLHACIKLVADNMDDPKLNTPDKVKFACKVALDFRYQDRVAIAPDGSVVFEYRSFCFDELKNMERLNVFQRGFEYLAGLLGTTVKELIREAQARMKPHGIP